MQYAEAGKQLAKSVRQITTCASDEDDRCWVKNLVITTRQIAFKSTCLGLILCFGSPHGLQLQLLDVAGCLWVLQCCAQISMSQPIQQTGSGRGCSNFWWKPVLAHMLGGCAIGGFQVCLSSLAWEVALQWAASQFRWTVLRKMTAVKVLAIQELLILPGALELCQPSSCMSEVSKYVRRDFMQEKQLIKGHPPITLERARRRS